MPAIEIKEDSRPGPGQGAPWTGVGDRTVRVAYSEQSWDDTLPLVLGFEERIGLNEEERNILEEAYQIGVERGKYLGSLIRDVTARTPVDEL